MKDCFSFGFISLSMIYLNNGSDYMKKIISMIIMFFMLIACHPSVERINIRGIESIQYEKLTQNLNSDVKFMLYIGRDDCRDCEEFYPILKDYMNHHEDAGIYYLNIREFRDKARSENATQEEIDFYENLYDYLDFDWTPTIHIVESGKFIKTYQYLDEDFYEIKDSVKQEKRKQEFIDQFQIFMDEYFKEEK